MRDLRLDTPAYWQLPDTVLDSVLAQVSSALPVLDVGCGMGHLVGRLSARGFSCVGIDKRPGRIAIARQRFPGCQFLVADIERYALERYGIIVMHLVVPFLRDPRRLLSRCRVATDRLLLTIPIVALGRDTLSPQALGRSMTWPEVEAVVSGIYRLAVVFVAQANDGTTITVLEGRA